MTPQEAIEMLTGKRVVKNARCNGKNKTTDELMQVVIEALEKQIPKLVIEEPWEHDPRFSILICPSCGSSSGCESSDGEALNFCNDCGQAIKWESE